MKKHELLEKAMRDYPKDKPCVSTHGIEFITSGQYFIDGTGSVADISGRAIYNKIDNKWAEIIRKKPASILEGKCAIQVNNEREFKLLMEHYESKGWESFKVSLHMPVLQFDEKYNCCDYHDDFRSSTKEIQLREGYTIIPFADFAKEVGITVPVFIMKSEDGVDLYEGDSYYRAYYFTVDSAHGHNIHNGWRQDVCNGLNKEHAVLINPEISKAFSTKEATEKWIEEENKPQFIIVSKDSQYPVEVYNDRIRIKCNGSENHSDNIIIRESELKEIYEAYYSLRD